MAHLKGKIDVMAKLEKILRGVDHGELLVKLTIHENQIVRIQKVPPIDRRRRRWKLSLSEK